MSRANLTTNQTEAVRRVDGDLLVSAAAGSGKTTVLAHRCAHLLLDAPVEQRCDANQLLVLTFTDAAATEMRSRIRTVLEERLAEVTAEDAFAGESPTSAFRAAAPAAPEAARIQHQIELLPLAQISTIHSFCLWLTRRHFQELDVDPLFELMDEAEARLLKRQVLDDLLEAIYRRSRNPELTTSDPNGKPAGAIAVETPPTDGAPLVGAAMAKSLDAASPDLPARLLTLVETYGGRNDQSITDFILSLGDYLSSLPDPESWLNSSVSRVCEHPERLIQEWIAFLRDDFRRLDEEAAARFGNLEPADPRLALMVQTVAAYREKLNTWRRSLETISLTDHAQPAAPFAALDAVLADVRSHPLDKPRQIRRNAKNDPDTEAVFEAVLESFDAFRKHAAKAQEQVPLSIRESLEGLHRVAPFVETLVEVVRLFVALLEQRKRDIACVEFSDLERFAYQLLRPQTSTLNTTPSANEIVTALRRRFRHVLIDEYQDISPIQEAIIRGVSRESDGIQEGNLFAVGDVRQSIYRFRLAEPSIFVDRQKALRAEPRNGLILLSENFRSRRGILDFVNAIFAVLMGNPAMQPGYNEEAWLRPGRDVDEASPLRRDDPPVEIHLIDSQATAANADGEGAEPPSGAGPEEARDAASGGDEGVDETAAEDEEAAHWNDLQKETLLAGRRLLELRIASSENAAHGGRAYEWEDFAILLRSASINAGKAAEALRSLGIPVAPPDSGAFLKSREVREAVAALRMLDNPLQDLPLAAVLRCGLFSKPFNEQELLDIRRSVPDAPFSAAFPACADPSAQRSGLGPSQGEAFEGLKEPPSARLISEPLAEKVRDTLKAVERWRHLARVRPVADVLWQFLDESGHFARCLALPDGLHRRSNLLELHHLASQFGRFRRQGLHRFLTFLEEVEDKLDAAPRGASRKAENGVRIMTIHAGKGLEFPVVFILGLGQKFNLSDTFRNMLFERDVGIGLSIVDRERMIRYPTLTSILAERASKKAALEEELRVLYVAMTRAAHRLILVATPKSRAKLLALFDAAAHSTKATAQPHAVTELEILGASAPIDWLLPLLKRFGPARLAFGDDLALPEALARVKLHHGAMTQGKAAEQPRANDAKAAAPRDMDMIAQSAEAADHLALTLAVRACRDRIEFLYPHLAANSFPSVVSASEAKRMMLDFDLDGLPADEAASEIPEPRAFARATMRCAEHLEIKQGDDARGGPPSPPDSPRPPAIDPREFGTAMHRILELLDVRLWSEQGFQAAIEKVKHAGRLSEGEWALVDLDALAWFATTALAAQLLIPSAQFYRELPFISLEPPGLFDPSAVDLPSEDRILVRGVIDLLIDDPRGLHIVDYKTDRLPQDQLAERVRLYAPQLQLYARAASRIWRRPVRACSLVFLSAREVVEVPNGSADLSDFPLPLT